MTAITETTQTTETTTDASTIQYETTERPGSIALHIRRPDDGREGRAYRCADGSYALWCDRYDDAPRLARHRYTLTSGGLLRRGDERDADDIIEVALPPAWVVWQQDIYRIVEAWTQYEWYGEPHRLVTMERASGQDAMGVDRWSTIETDDVTSRLVEAIADARYRR